MGRKSLVEGVAERILLDEDSPVVSWKREGEPIVSAKEVVVKYHLSHTASYDVKALVESALKAREAPLAHRMDKPILWKPDPAVVASAHAKMAALKAKNEPENQDSTLIA